MRPDQPSHARRSEQGWALASVLWGVTMLSLMAVAGQDLALTSHRTERRAWDRARTDAALQAGITQTIVGIAAQTGDRWRVDGASRQIPFAGFNLKVTVQDE